MCMNFSCKNIILRWQIKYMKINIMRSILSNLFKESHLLWSLLLSPRADLMD